MTLRKLLKTTRRYGRTACETFLTYFPQSKQTAKELPRRLGSNVILLLPVEKERPDRSAICQLIPTTFRPITFIYNFTLLPGHLSFGLHRPRFVMSFDLISRHDLPVSVQLSNEFIYPSFRPPHSIVRSRTTIYNFILIINSTWASHSPLPRSSP